MGRFSASLIQELEELQETGMSREEAELTLLQEKRPQGPDQWLRLLSRKSAVYLVGTRSELVVARPA